MCFKSGGDQYAQNSDLISFLFNTQAMSGLMCTKRFRNSTVKHASDFNTTTGQSMGVTTFDLETEKGKLSNREIQRCAMFSSFLFKFSFLSRINVQNCLKGNYTVHLSAVHENSLSLSFSLPRPPPPPPPPFPFFLILVKRACG